MLHNIKIYNISYYYDYSFPRLLRNKKFEAESNFEVPEENLNSLSLGHTMLEALQYFDSAYFLTVVKFKVLDALLRWRRCNANTASTSSSSP
jgi:hypothetical protein